MLKASDKSQIRMGTALVAVVECLVEFSLHNILGKDTRGIRDTGEFWACERLAALYS